MFLKCVVIILEYFKINVKICIIFSWNQLSANNMYDALINYISFSCEFTLYLISINLFRGTNEAISSDVF